MRDEVREFPRKQDKQPSMFAERNPWQAKDVAASAPPTAEQLLARFRTEAFMVGHNAIQAMMKGDR